MGCSQRVGRVINTIRLYLCIFFFFYNWLYLCIKIPFLGVFSLCLEVIVMYSKCYELWLLVNAQYFPHRVMLIYFSPRTFGFWNVWIIIALDGWNHMIILPKKERRGEHSRYFLILKSDNDCSWQLTALCWLEVTTVLARPWTGPKLAHGQRFSPGQLNRPVEYGPIELPTWCVIILLLFSRLYS